MRMDKLTSKFQLALADAQSLATGLDHQLIEPAHVMVALLDQEGGASRHLLTKAGVRVNPLRSQLGERLDSLPRVSGAEGEISLSNDLIKMLNLTDAEKDLRCDKHRLRKLLSAVHDPVTDSLDLVHAFLVETDLRGLTPILEKGWSLSSSTHYMLCPDQL